MEASFEDRTRHDPAMAPKRVFEHAPRSKWASAARRSFDYMTRAIKGMVKVGATTYRIERLERGRYAVVRIHDDHEIGKFKTVPRLALEDGSENPSELQRVAQEAVRLARTSAVMHVAPVPKPPKSEVPPSSAKVG